MFDKFKGKQKTATFNNVILFLRRGKSIISNQIGIEES